MPYEQDSADRHLGLGLAQRRCRESIVPFSS
jgi:uncharacterized protein (TIGR03118 family)